jgi:hypothetical protein
MVYNLKSFFKVAFNAIYDGKLHVISVILICITCSASPGTAYAEDAQPFTADDINNVISGPPYPDNKSYTPELIQLMDINGDAEVDINDVMAFKNATDTNGDGLVTVVDAVASQINPNPTLVQGSELAGSWLVRANFKSKNFQVPTVSYAFVLNFDAPSRTATVIDLPVANPTQPLVKQVNVDKNKKFVKRTQASSPSNVIGVGKQFKQNEQKQWLITAPVQMKLFGLELSKSWTIYIDTAAVTSQKTEQGTITEQTSVANSNIGPITTEGTIRLTSLNE